MSDKHRMTVAIAGAGGFIGAALRRELAGDYRIIGLSRRDPPRSESEVEWRRCDLFSLFECERALAGAGTAFYLAHSMLPSSHLTQGTFQDLDLIGADNFARAAARAGVSRIIYLGGIIPGSEGLSRHIASRGEVERTLAAQGVPVTTLRAGIIIGLRGSSYGMFRSIIERLPLVLCPRWSDSLIQPIALADAIRLLRHALEHGGGASRSVDIGCRDVLTYRELLRRSARIMGKKRLIVRVPFAWLRLSKLFLALVSGYPHQLVSPLVESLKHSLVARDLDFQEQAGLEPLSFAEAVRASLAEEGGGTRFRDILAAQSRARHRIPPGGGKSVRSVQRIPLPSGKNSRWLALQYMDWLPRFLRFPLWARRDGRGGLLIGCRPAKTPLLELSFAGERSAGASRQLFYIVGGLLARKVDQPTRRPRLEFRDVLGGSAALVAIHDYVPTIPWPLYNSTQALAHLWVMRNFSRAIAAGEPSLGK